MIAIRSHGEPRQLRAGRDKRKSKLSESDEWRTPPDLFAALSATYGPFTLDAAASASNHLLPRYFTKETSALERSWAAATTNGRAWLNPPYSRGSLDPFMAKARAEVLDELALVPCLVPHYTAEGWWHRHVEGPAGALLRMTSTSTLLGPCTRLEWQHLTLDVLRIRGRVRHIEASGATGPARFSSVVVVFARPGLLPPFIAPRQRGPASCVTPEMERAIRSFVDAGGTIAQACLAAGIARKTWYRHLERLHHQRSRLRADQVTQQPDTREDLQ